MTDFDFEQAIEERRKEEQKKQEKWLAGAVNKIADDHELIYFMMGLFIQYRFNIAPQYNGEPNDIVWGILDNYINNFNGDIKDYLYSDNGPMVRRMCEIPRMFPELVEMIPKGSHYEDIDTNKEILKLANKLYGLEMEPDDDYFGAEYFYALKFDFNAFQPIDIDKAKRLKKEKIILEKYGHDASAIDERLKEFGLTEEQLECL